MSPFGDKTVFVRGVTDVRTTERVISMQEVRQRLRRSEKLFRIVFWFQVVFTIISVAGLILRLSTGYKHGMTIMVVSSVFLIAASLLQGMTSNQRLRTCSNCFQELSARELLSAPDSYCCPHCGKPFQAKIDTEEFSF